VTTGLVDELPDVPGLAERWGRDVLHCPYCHGWEVRDRAIGVLATSRMATHHAQMFRQLSQDVTLFLHTTTLEDAERERLSARGIALVDGEVAGLEVIDDELTGVRLRSGEVVKCQALAIQPRFVARSGLLSGLGLDPVEIDGIGSRIPAEPNGATAIPGLWVAGNVTDLMSWVISAAAAGATTGAVINADLIEEEIGQALVSR
jgi:thioredoxin reductase